MFLFYTLFENFSDSFTEIVPNNTFKKVIYHLSIPFYINQLGDKNE